MIYGSVCSGIEAASVAWGPLGWRASFLSEIDRFPRAVLKHRFPEVPIHGDFTTIRGGQYPDIDLLVGGTPCQSFSVAGLRGGMDDARGGLALEFLLLAARLRARWLVWENVPGVLSADTDRALGAFLGGLAELGYGFAYRVLDAQYFGVPQRRRRVFVVGHSGGNWQRCAAVLFERASLSGHPPPCRETREDVAACVTTGTGRRYDTDTDTDTFVTGPLAGHHGGNDLDGSTPLFVHGHHGDNGAGIGREGDPAFTLDTTGSQGVAHSLRAQGQSSHRADSETFAIDIVQVTSRANRSQPGTLAGSSNVVTFTGEDGLADPISASEAKTYSHEGANFRMHNVVRQGVQGVRRLTPRECERLQGFPDDWTAIPIGKRGTIAKDSPRYKAIGNSMAVPVVAWIGRRIEAVDRMAPILEAS